MISAKDELRHVLDLTPMDEVQRHLLQRLISRMTEAEAEALLLLVTPTTNDE
jgi:hypothetical protein